MHQKAVRQVVAGRSQNRNSNKKLKQKIDKYENPKASPRWPEFVKAILWYQQSIVGIMICGTDRP